MKQGDLEPDLIIDIAGLGGDLRDVVSWKVVGRLRGNAAVVVNDTDPTVVVDPDDPTKASVTHRWVAGETDTAGILLLEVEATWPGDRKQTFPTYGFSVVRISDDLD